MYKIFFKKKSDMLFCPFTVKFDFFVRYHQENYLTCT